MKSIIQHINESKIVNFDTYTEAIQTALDYIEKKGFSVTDDERFNKIGVNSTRPKKGDTTKISLEIYKGDKLQRQGFHIQVYNRGTDRNPYELNYYLR